MTRNHHRRVLSGAAVFALAALLATAGCSSGEDGGMKVWGYVASPEQAKLELDESQSGSDVVVIGRVVAPGEAWLVVHRDDNGMPGERVGLKHVPAGESKDVSVPLENVTGDTVIVAVHADKGTRGTFDFDMMKKEMSPDRPYFVNEKELATIVTLQR